MAAAWAKTVATDVVSSKPAIVAIFILPCSCQLRSWGAISVFCFQMLQFTQRDPGSCVAYNNNVCASPHSTFNYVVTLHTFYYNSGGKPANLTCDKMLDYFIRNRERDNLLPSMARPYMALIN